MSNDEAAARRRAPWRRGRPPARSPAAATSSAGSSHSPASACAPAGVGAERPARLDARSARPPGPPARARTARAARRCRRASSAGPWPAGPGRCARPSVSGRGISAASASAERLLEPAQRLAQLEVAEHLAQPASGRARGPSSAARSSSTGTSRTIVASCLESRASSACSVRFCLRLAPEMSSTWASTPSRSPKRCSSSAAVLSPMPGTPGMLSEVSPLRPMKSGIELGRDAVALDHARGGRRRACR